MKINNGISLGNIWTIAITLLALAVLWGSGQTKIQNVENDIEKLEVSKADKDVIEVKIDYTEYGAIGVIVSLFVMLIMNLMRSQKMQNEDLDSIRQANAKLETKMGNVESIILKMLDRWNKSDDVSQRHREDIVKELNDVTDDLAYLKGRINGKS